MQLATLIETFTVEYRGKIYLRVELFDSGVDGPTRFFSEVYLLRYPAGLLAVSEGVSDRSFRQHWMYLDDFLMQREADLSSIRSSVIAEIGKYGDRYLGRFDPDLRRQG